MAHPTTNPSGWPEIREAVIARDGHACQTCGGTDPLEVHHILPRTNGGDDELSNLITLCKACHRDVHRIMGDLVWDHAVRLAQEEVGDHGPVSHGTARRAEEILWRIRPTFYGAKAAA